MSVEQETTGQFYLAFYEDGKFSNYVGDAYGDENSARFAMARLALTFPLPVHFAADNNSFAYDRYGTPCSVKIVEV